MLCNWSSSEIRDEKYILMISNNLKWKRRGKSFFCFFMNKELGQQLKASLIQ